MHVNLQTMESTSSQTTLIYDLDALAFEYEEKGLTKEQIVDALEEYVALVRDLGGFAFGAR
jgi:hypothetical protein